MLHKNSQSASRFESTSFLDGRSREFGSASRGDISVPVSLNRLFKEKSFRALCCDCDDGRNKSEYQRYQVVDQYKFVSETFTETFLKFQ